VITPTAYLNFQLPQILKKNYQKVHRVKISIPGNREQPQVYLLITLIAAWIAFASPGVVAEGLEVEQRIWIFESHPHPKN